MARGQKFENNFPNYCTAGLSAHCGTLFMRALWRTLPHIFDYNEQKSLNICTFLCFSFDAFEVRFFPFSDQEALRWKVQEMNSISTAQKTENFFRYFKIDLGRNKSRQRSNIFWLKCSPRPRDKELFIFIKIFQIFQFFGFVQLFMLSWIHFIQHENTYWQNFYNFT